MVYSFNHACINQFAIVQCLLPAFLTWTLVTAAASLLFHNISLGAGHHHPLVWHQGDSIDEVCGAFEEYVFDGCVSVRDCGSGRAYFMVTYFLCNYLSYIHQLTYFNRRVTGESFS